MQKSASWTETSRISRAIRLILCLLFLQIEVSRDCNIYGDRLSSGGPRARKSYFLTDEGRKVLEMLRGPFEELYREVCLNA